jgi:LysM repeat protein
VTEVENPIIECWGGIVYRRPMSFSESLCRGVVLLLAGLVLSGCLPSTQSQLDEEKEPHYQAGKHRLNTLDYKGAAESFEKALTVNPRSGLAHFELGCLYETKQADPAAAIYHYEQYLKLRPDGDYAEMAKQHILICKQELARTVSLGPVTQTLQREFEQLATENKRLKEDLEKWRAFALQLQAVTNQLGAAAATQRTTPTSLPENPQTSRGASQIEKSQADRPDATPPTTARPTPTTSTRIHVVKAGETLATIARKYNVRVSSLQNANPRVDARRLRVGQSLTIPAS